MAETGGGKTSLAFKKGIPTPAQKTPTVACVSSARNDRAIGNAVGKGMGSSAGRRHGAVVAKVGEIKMRSIREIAR